MVRISLSGSSDFSHSRIIQINMKKYTGVKKGILGVDVSRYSLLNARLEIKFIFLYT